MAEQNEQNKPVIVEIPITRQVGDVTHVDVRTFVKEGADLDQTIKALIDAGFNETHGEGLVNS